MRRAIGGAGMSVGGPQKAISEHKECTCGTVAPRPHDAYCPLGWDFTPEQLPDFDTPRSAISVLTDIAQLLSEQNLELAHIHAAFDRLSIGGESGGEERLPSISVEDMAKGDPKITTKSYDGRPLTPSLVDQHLAAHAYAKRKATELLMNGWAEEVAGRNGGG